MRKLFSAFMLTLGATLFVGCNDNSDFDDNGYSDTYPGIVLYDEAKFASTLALDGMSFGMKFAILQTEMEADGLSFPKDENGQIKYNTELSDDEWATLGSYTFEPQDKEFTIKNYLFGSNENVKIVQSAATEYRFTYGTGESSHTFAPYDLLSRRGTMVLDTGGLKLNETTASTPWTISYLVGSEGGEDDNMSYQLTSREIACSELVTTLHFEDGKFVYSGSVKSRYSTDSGVGNTWSGTGSLRTTSSDLSFDNTVRSTYTYDGEMSGVSVNGDLALRHEITSDLKYTPNSIPFRSVAGSEEVSLTQSHAVFEYSKVTVNSLSSGYREFTYGPFTYTER